MPSKERSPRFICYLIFTLSAYPGIYTSVITCIVCSLSTVGASLQKGILRFAGAAVGGALGFISLMYIFPHLDSLGGFWFPFGAVMALAAYVNFGSPRISYCGIQICLAFCKCVHANLRHLHRTARGARPPHRDRPGTRGVWSHQQPALAGHGAGIPCARNWRPSCARSRNLPACPTQKDHAPQLTEAYALRLQVYQDFGAVRELLESSKFESGAERRDRLEAIRDATQALFLRQLAIIQHRSDLRPSSVPEPIRAASVKFRATLAEVLLNLSDRVEGKAERAHARPASALAELSKPSPAISTR